jgi:hypothetical protein
MKMMMISKLQNTGQTKNQIQKPREEKSSTETQKLRKKIKFELQKKKIKFDLQKKKNQIRTADKLRANMFTWFMPLAGLTAGALGPSILWYR